MNIMFWKNWSELSSILEYFVEYILTAQFLDIQSCQMQKVQFSEKVSQMLYTYDSYSFEKIVLF